MHLREDEKITHYLSKFGMHRKIIFYINGYGQDMNPDDDSGKGYQMIFHHFSMYINCVHFFY